MDRCAFTNLCTRLEMNEALKPAKHLLVDEQVAMFLHIIAHHVKNRVISFKFLRLGDTVSKYFHNVLHFVIRLHGKLLKKPERVLVNSTDERWKWFKKCLGALDGTYIRVRVPAADKPSWEGLATDDRVLREALRKTNGLNIPNGYYYLVDAGYVNSPGLLAPYRGQRYHLNDWRENYQPTNPQEFFNMKHSSARNVIERCFGMLKNQWAIPKSPSFYPINTQNRIIMACCLLHNFLKREMPCDPFEESFDVVTGVESLGNSITSIETSEEWNA